jgi:hypothetical protein
MTFSASGAGSAGNPRTAQTANTTNIPHWRGRGPDDGAGNGDLPAPTPREIENHEEGDRRIDECADPHAGCDEARIGLLHLQPINVRGDDDGVDR